MISLKKLASTVLALTMCASLGSTAFASEPETYTENPNVRVVNRSAHINEQAIKELVNDVSANLVYDDGTIVPVESVVTITDVASKNRNSGNAYQVAVRSKVESDSDDKNSEGVTASIFIKLTWEDRPGPMNYFESFEGNIDITRGAISNSNVIYGTSANASNSKLELGTKTSFYKSVNGTAPSPTVLYSVYFKNATFGLDVSVTPSIFD